MTPAAQMPTLEPQLGLVGAMPNPGRGFYLCRMEVCLLWRSEILRAVCLPAGRMGASGANRAVLLWGARLAPLFLSPLPGHHSESRTSSRSPFAEHHPRKLGHPFAIHLEGAGKSTPHLQPAAPLARAGDAFLPSSRQDPLAAADVRVPGPNTARSVASPRTPGKRCWDPSEEL